MLERVKFYKLSSFLFRGGGKQGKFLVTAAVEAL